MAPVKVLLLNSGLGARMGAATASRPKGLLAIDGGETLLSRQLRLLHKAGLKNIVVTTGFAGDTLTSYCHSLNLPLHYTFVANPLYAETNYIYSIYLARERLSGDLILLHGDLVFESSVLEDLRACAASVMAISTKIPLPKKDFKAVLKDGMIDKIGVEYFTNAYAAQPFYKLNAQDWQIWLEAIEDFVSRGQRKCYAEDAFNQVADQCSIYPLDYGQRLCCEVDTPTDLTRVNHRLASLKERTDSQ